MTRDLLIKFLDDRCSEEELYEVVKWIRDKPINHSQRTLIKQVWDSYVADDSLPDDKRFDSLLDKIHDKIDIREQHYHTPHTVKLISTWLTKAAAVLFIPVLGFLFYMLTRESSVKKYQTDMIVDSLEIVTPVGTQISVQLSDGSEVYLNHGSRLYYPHIFKGNTREVTLQGEAYFDVAHNHDKPFVVKTKHLNVKAIGTSFNVFAYPEEDFVSTTLIKGKVILEKIIEDNKAEVIGSMIPGQHVSYDICNDEISSENDDIDRYISWKDGKLVFKNESIIQITQRLSRWYNVEFEFADDASKEYTYTATFVDETLDQILSLLQIATPITYNKIPRQQLPDGTFSKQKIVIEKSK